MGQAGRGRQSLPDSATRNTPKAANRFFLPRVKLAVPHGWGGAAHHLKQMISGPFARNTALGHSRHQRCAIVFGGRVPRYIQIALISLSVMPRYSSQGMMVSIGAPPGRLPCRSAVKKSASL